MIAPLSNELASKSGNLVVYDFLHVHIVFQDKVQLRFLLRKFF